MKRRLGFRREATGLLVALALGNVAVWLWAWQAFATRPALLGSALLAWVFGLRHAVDADHIAAIDNSVRKLMQDGRQPVAVGAWFSFGHSTVVIVASMLIAGLAVTFEGELRAYKTIGGVIGTLMSGGFLLVVAGINVVILRTVWLRFRAMRRGAARDSDHGGCQAGVVPDPS